MHKEWIVGCAVLCGLAAPASAERFTTSECMQDLRVDPYARTSDTSKGEDANYAIVPAVPHQPATLLVFLPGHGASLDGYQDFMNAAADEGYYVIGLAYKNGQSIQNMCGFWADCASYLMDQNVSKDTDNGFYKVDRNQYPAKYNSINYRLNRFLMYLKDLHFGFGFDWEQFYDYSTNDVQWSKIVIAGHSLGGATATWITKNKPVQAGIVFEAPYSDLDNATVDGAPFDQPGYTPCAPSLGTCPYTAHGGHRDQNAFATYLHNDSSNWVNKLWITLSTWDKGYDNSSNVVSCTASNTGVCGKDAVCSIFGQCTIPTWAGVIMSGAALALGKSEHVMAQAPTSLDGHKWWTSVTRPQGECSGHGATVNDGCYPYWMPAYWSLVLQAARN